MIEKIYCKEEMVAIIIRSNFDKAGIEFVTPGDFSQQMAYMHHPKGYNILPHFHNEVKRTVHYTQETLVIKKGKIRVNFYDSNCKYQKNVVIQEGDVILLAGGGHGFEILEETIMIEIKQGPYAGEADKTRFYPVGQEG
ncbi:MAG: hypothetical protein NC429_10070 [Lachnospiraceae bacterium]|nr:hypothetical protein [Lachnospiraceae bacterium]